MADNEQVIVDVTYNTEDAQKNVSDLTKEIVRLEKEQKKLKERLDEGEISQEDYSRAIEANRVELTKNKAERRDNIKFLKSEKGSQDQLQKSIKLLTNDRKKLNIETEEGRAEAARLNKQIDSLRDTTNESSSAFEQNKNNIGNYKESITEALKEAGLFGGGLKENISGLFQQATAGKAAAGSTKMLTNGLLQQTVALKGTSGGLVQASGSFKMLGKAAWAFTKIPIILIITAIVLAIKGLVEAIKRNEGVMKKFREVWSGISNVIEEVIGRFQKIVNISIKLFKGQISLREGINESKDAFTGMGESIKNAYDEGVKLVELQKQIAKTNRENTVELAKLNQEYEKQQRIADDSTISLEEQLVAREKAAKLGREIAQIEADAAALALSEVEKRAEIAERQGRLEADPELMNELAEATAANIVAQSNLLAVIEENAIKRREIQENIFQEELDFILDVADARKTVNERQIADEKRTFAERKKILNETNGFIEESFEQQIKLFEEYANINIDVNKLINLNNEEIVDYAKGLNLSEAVTTRLIEVIRERIMAVGDLREAEEDLFASEQEMREKMREQQDKDIEKMKEQQDKDLEDDIENINAKADAELEAANRVADENEKLRQKQLDDEQAAAEARAAIITDSYLQIADLFADFVSGEIQTFKEFSKELGILLINQLEKVLIAKNAEILFRSLASRDSIATFGISGIARAAGLILLTKAAASAAKAGIQSLKEGGELKFGTFGGRPHSQGGTNIYDDNGRLLANVERNERFFVLKNYKKDQINALSRKNVSMGGRSFEDSPVRKAQEGGRIEIPSDSGLTAKDVREIIRQTPIQVSVEDLASGLNQRSDALNVGVID